MINNKICTLFLFNDVKEALCSDNQWFWINKVQTIEVPLK